MRRLALIPMLLVGFLLGGDLVFRSEAPASTKAVSSTLHATVGPLFQIQLSFDDGTPVTNLPAGTYTIDVKDLSDQHNFHLFGPGVDEKTEIFATTETSWTVTFQDANGYTFQCDAHSSLTGTFTVGNLPAPAPVTSHAAETTPPPPPPSLPLRGSLQALVGPASQIGLVKAGKTLRKVPRGIYQLVISDKTKKDGLTLRQVVGGALTQELTAAGFVGRKTVSVELRPGKWKVYSGAREQAVYSFFDVT